MGAFAEPYTRHLKTAHRRLKTQFRNRIVGAFAEPYTQNLKTENRKLKPENQNRIVTASLTLNPES